MQKKRVIDLSGWNVVTSYPAVTLIVMPIPRRKQNPQQRHMFALARAWWTNCGLTLRIR